MKTQEEIEQLAEKEYPIQLNENHYKPDVYDDLNENNRNAYVEGYTQCQEDMADKIFTLDDVNKIINLAYVSGGGNDTYQECIDFVYEQMNINSLNKQD
jgi:hypothetical protein